MIPQMLGWMPFFSQLAAGAAVPVSRGHGNPASDLQDRLAVPKLWASDSPRAVPPKLTMLLPDDSAVLEDVARTLSISLPILGLLKVVLSTCLRSRIPWTQDLAATVGTTLQLMLEFPLRTGALDV